VYCYPPHFTDEQPTLKACRLEEINEEEEEEEEEEEKGVSNMQRILDL